VLPADHRQPVGVVQPLRRRDLLAQDRGGLVLDPLPPLLQDHVALRVDVLVGEAQVRHPVRLHPHDQGQAVLRDHLEVGGEVVAGDGVVVAAVPGHDLRELAGRDLLRALEHQVLEEVRQAGLRLRAVGGADPVPEPVRHDRRPAVRHDDDLEAVVEREGLRVEQRRGDLQGPALGQAARGAECQRRSRQARLLTAPGAGCFRCER
jgi:hypothetical protein